MALDMDLVTQGAATNGKESRNASIRFFRNLLKSKNILVLQECYGALLKAFETALDESNAKHVLFVLECLSDVIHAKGSILSMWALDPPVFLLLAQKGRLLDGYFCKYQPLTHFAILKMFKTHCKCHHQFLASSQLLTTNQTTLTSMAPTSKYFQILLQTITEIIKLDLNSASRDLMLDWIRDVLQNTGKSNHELVRSQEFILFIESVLESYNLEIFDCLIDNYSIPKYQDKVYLRLIQLLNSNDPKERKISTDLIPKLSPLGLDWNKGQLQLLDSASKDIKLRTNEFKSLAELMICKIGKSQNQDKDLQDILGLLGQDFKYRQTKLIWVGDQIANYCINNKLKTTLGKAQETLGAYEKTMRLFANTLGKQELSPEKIRQARNYLIVFERLEKAMSNAWDGNNLAAFFVANKKTCLDWLSRNELSLHQNTDKNVTFKKFYEQGRAC